MLPEKRSSPFQATPNTGAIDEARRIDVRPRGSTPRPGELSVEGGEPSAPASDEVLLHFSCPGCLHMMAVPRQSTSVQCPECSAWVMPPQVINMGLPLAGKTALPPPKKTGAHGLKR